MAGDPTIDVVPANHVVSGSEEFQASVDCRHAAGKTDGVIGALDGGKILF
jgi:hypothetical protein